MAIKELWVDKYRPRTVDEYVFGSEALRVQVEQWIATKSFGNLMLVGSAGTGKSSIARMLIEQCEVDEYDVLIVNASKENSVDDVRNRISTFVGTMPFGEFKVVLLEEADYITLNGQGALRALIEECSDTVRFILTANYAHKIMPAIHSRCPCVQFQKLDVTEFTVRVATILLEENIEFEIETLEMYVKASYPDLRKCIGTVQQYSATGSLLKPSAASVSDSVDDYKVKAVELFKAGKIRDARKVICESVRPDELDGFFRWCYDNIDLWGSTPEQQDEAILIIRKGLVNSAVCADHEINISAMMVELSKIN